MGTWRGGTQEERRWGNWIKQERELPPFLILHVSQVLLKIRIVMLTGDKENAPNVLIFSPPRAMRREEMFKVSWHVLSSYHASLNTEILA